MSEAAAENSLLLGVDTSSEGDLVLVRLTSNGELMQLARQQFSAREQSAELLPRLTELLQTAQVKLQDVSAIVVVSGPGSFTGLRIGLSAVKGLAHATKIPVIAVSSLAVIAGPAAHDTVTITIAGRSEYYVRRPGQDGEPSDESLVAETDLLPALGNFAVVVTDNALAAKLSSTHAVSVVHPGALDAVRTALPRLRAKDFDAIATLDANYVRRPYTERTATAQPAAVR